MFVTIHHQSHLVLGISMSEVFWFLIQSLVILQLCRFSMSSRIIFRSFHVRICPYYLGYLICWHTIIHHISPYSWFFFYVMVIVMSSLSFLILVSWIFFFFLGGPSWSFFFSIIDHLFKRHSFRLMDFLYSFQFSISCITAFVFISPFLFFTLVILSSSFLYFPRWRFMLSFKGCFLF